MTETYFPFDSGPGMAITEDQWRQLGGGIGSKPGVIPGSGNELSITPGSGRQVLVDSGDVFCFGHLYSNSSPLGITIAANDSGTVRWDAIVIEFDWAANVAAAKAVQSTPGGSFVTPAASLTTKWQVVRGWVAVQPGVMTVTSGDIYQLEDCWASSVGDMPTGTLVPWVGVEGAQPRGYIFPFGQTLLGIQYPRLAALLPTYDAGATTQWGISLGVIVVPDLRGRVPICPDSIQGSAANRLVGGNAPGGYGGTSIIAANDLPSHTHGITGPSHDHMPDVVQDANGNWPVLIQDPFSTYGVPFRPLQSGDTAALFTRFASETATPARTESQGTAQNTNSKMPPYATVNYLLKVA